MRKKKNFGSSNRKGNIILTFFSIIFCFSVILITIFLLNLTPAAIPAVKDFSEALYPSLKLPAQLISSSSESSQVSSSSASSQSETSSTVNNSSLPAVETLKAQNDLKKALFIGDSYTDGLSMYCTVPKTNVFCSNSMTAYGASEKKYSYNERTVKAEDIAEELKPDGIFIMLGCNDLAQGYSAAKFSTYYETLVENLKKSSPDSHIYIQSVLPVSAAFSDKNKSGLNSEGISKYNEALKELSASLNVVYLDVASAVSDPDGFLPSKSTVDGYHLKPGPYSDWMQFLEQN